MIDAKSLRIGNIVTAKNPQWCKLIGIPMIVISISQRAEPDFPESNASITMQCGKDLYNQFNEFVCGVPLSEDILIKAGFTRASALLDTVFSINYDGNALIGYWLDGVVNVGEFAPKNIKYLHEIQNLYYALTGTELTINL